MTSVLFCFKQSIQVRIQTVSKDLMVKKKNLLE